jgi:hypothetical protein
MPILPLSSASVSVGVVGNFAASSRAAADIMAQLIERAMLQVRSRLGCLGRSREDFAPVAKEQLAHVACKHLQGDGTTLSGIRYPHAVRHWIHSMERRGGNGEGTQEAQ